MRSERNVVGAQQKTANLSGKRSQSRTTRGVKGTKTTTKSGSSQGADQQHREKIASFVQDLFSQAWLQNLMKEIQAREPKSIEQLAELRKSSASSPALWPLHAIPMPICVDRAEGSRLWDVDGNEYIDFHVGFGTQSLHGHNPEPVVRAVKEVMGRAPGNGYFNSLELKHVQLLKELIPHRERFSFLNSGSDATAAAIRMSRAFTGRKLVVRFEGGLNGQVDMVSYNSHPFYMGHPLMPFPNKDKNGIQLKSYLPGSQTLSKDDMIIVGFNDPMALEIIKKRKDEIACVLTEPIPMSIPYPEKTIPFIRELGEVCRKSNVILVLDEVTSGFRYGPAGVAGHFNLHADLITYGKVLGGLGIPLSAVGGRSDILEMTVTTGMSIMDYGRRMFMATTHAGNSLALAASYASLSLLKEKGSAFYERTRQKISRFREGLAKLDVEPGMSLQLLGYGEFAGGLAFMKDAHVNANHMREFAPNMNPFATGVLTLMLRRKGIYFFSAPWFYSGDAHSQQDFDTLLGHIADSVKEMKRNGFSFTAMPL